MQTLPVAAVHTGGEVFFVVATHLGREAGNIIAPARQDLAHDRINALTHMQLLIFITVDRGYCRSTLRSNYVPNPQVRQNRIGCMGSACAASMTRLCNSVRRPDKAFSASFRARSGWLFSSERCANTI